ncbi:hypothetical protein [Brevundimonas sp.]|uniref:hypothetical protein n=1 Tax=Brevundimonas sp. TaxID=1871086 RepID=UPI0025C2BA6F|nr:hypothetical protein [Brevundimonas sp.]
MNRSVVVTVFALLLTLPLGKPAASQDRAVTLEWVQLFEQSLDLNEALNNDASYRGHLSLETYARYYEIAEIDGVRLVNATYARPIERYPDDWMSCTYRDGAMTDCRPVTQPSEDLLRRRGRGVHLDEPAPSVADGGCGYVTLWIEPETLRVAGAYCNGVA